MNEEQKAWLERVKKVIADCESGVETFEETVTLVQDAVYAAPEP